MRWTMSAASVCVCVCVCVKTYCLRKPLKSSYFGSWKNRVLCFLPKNSLSTHFLRKKTLKTLLNQYMATKKPNKPPQNPKSTQNKNSFQA